MSHNLDENDINLEKKEQNRLGVQSQKIKFDFSQKQEQVNEVDIFDAGKESGELRHPKIFKFLDSNIFGFFVTILTVYALFGDDIKTIAFDRTADLIFDIITSISFFVFLSEIIMSWIVKDDYQYSFFFWLDVISTLSLILDVQLINDQLFSSTTATNTAQLARAGRASRVGTKAGRIVRLVRLIRIVKLYKATQDNNEIKEKQKIQPYGLKKKFVNNFSPLKPLDGDQIIEQEEPQIPDEMLDFKESRVSKQLSNLTTKRVIVIVLLLLFVMPLFSADYFYDWPDPLDYSISTLKSFTEDPNTTISDIVNYYEQIRVTLIALDSPLVSLTGPFNFTKDFNEGNWATVLREGEMNKVTYSVDPALFSLKYSLKYFQENGKFDYIGVISNKAVTIVDSGLSLGRTIFVCIVLTMGALFFSKDANELALRPIERMMHKVNQIARNPLLAKEQKLLEEKEEDHQYETTIIENAIIKIGTLLALGFGDAGSEIIGSNMKTLGDVNPMIPGKKRVAIYGFCDIRNFTDATEQLQKDVMVFVNSIGEIVHTIVDRFNGAANKNIGDAFLLVWKFPDEKVSINDKNEINYINKQWVDIQADYACISFVKIQAKINRRTKILDYRHDTRLTSRMPNYKVKIGYGLHIGWSIEGAIGSDYKIDASYLSAHVNMANRLESGTKAYGIPILITSQLANLFTSKMKEIVRQIDIVEVKGFGSFFGLYTVDMKVEDLPPCSDSTIRTPNDLLRQEKHRKSILKQYQDENTWDARKYMISNKEIRVMCFEFVDPNLRKNKRELINAIIQFKNSDKQQQESIDSAGDVVGAKYKLDDFQNKNNDFRIEFDEGFYLYTRGRWLESKVSFEKAQHCLNQKGEPMDGPTTVLLGFMGASEFRAPSDWKGYRFTGEL